MRIYCYSHVNNEFWESTLAEFLNELNELNECLYKMQKNNGYYSKNKFCVYSTSKLGLMKLINKEESNWKNKLLKH